MTARQIVGGAVLVIIGLPVELVLTAGLCGYGLLALRASHRSSGVIVSSGEPRDYLLYVPPAYDRTRPTSLVISLHGAGGWPAQQMETTRWNRLADAHGFIVVYPSGQGFPRVWHVDRGDGLARDVRFISDLIDHLEAAFNIDPLRVYANGLSNGGGMAFVLSCTLSDRIAAVGLVAAAQTLPWSWCTDHRPVPMMAFHGTSDLFVPYNGGGSPVASKPFPGVVTWTEDWARRNRCGARAADAVVAPDVTRLEYTHCAGDADVVLYSVKGGGHSWPGGQPLPAWMVGTTSAGVDATTRLWEFFQDHPRRDAPVEAHRR